MNGDLWSTGAARAFSVRLELDRIEGAARGCGVFAGRWCVGTDERAVRVRRRSQLWLVYPDPDGDGWVAAPAATDGPDLTSARRLGRAPGEGRIPTQAWAELLAGVECGELSVAGPVPAPATSRSGSPAGAARGVRAARAS